jgi:hypothetical protein
VCGLQGRFVLRSCFAAKVTKSDLSVQQTVHHLQDDIKGDPLIKFSALFVYFRVRIEVWSYSSKRFAFFQTL